MKHESIFNNKNVTIVVTDSGLGGISITADLTERLKKTGVFQNAQVVFFNASFDNRSGYNVISNHQEKIRIFNNALNSIAQKYHPDLILIGCNTLSVLYPETPFAADTHIPVSGIVEVGVESILKEHRLQSNAMILLFGTATTINNGLHKQKLIEQGIPEQQIVGISCGNLADLIEEGPESIATKERILSCIQKVVPQLAHKATAVIAGLVCTHYGYSVNIFRNMLTRTGFETVTIVNPNPRMADFLFEPERIYRYQKTEVSVEVICKVFIFPEIMQSITQLIGPISAQTADAIRNYQRDEFLF